MPEPRDPLLKVLTYSVHKLREAMCCKRVWGIPPAGASPHAAGAGDRPRGAEAPPAEATEGSVHNGLVSCVTL
ncbi:hypothetical protein VTJ04DRAFT_2102 [Mycothermus thermophilus]